MALRGGLLLMLGAPLALGQIHGIPGPVVHQLVQVVGERALAALGRSGRRLGLVLPRPWSTHRIGAARPCKRRDEERKDGKKEKEQVIYECYTVNELK